MKPTVCLMLTLSLCVTIAIGSQLRAQIPDLENHYTFDDSDNPEFDSSGNDRHGTIDDFAGFIEWVEDEDPARGGVLELEGGNQGFFFAEIPELPGDDFTVAFWAYRNPDTAGPANDGLFQIQSGGETPTTDPPSKVIGAWVGANSDIWGRVNQANGQTMNLGRDIAYIFEEEWTHLAYRGDGSTFEVLVNADNSDGLSVGYDGVLKPHDTLFVGKQGNESWGGRLDDFRVYSRALTDEEIATVMAGDVGGSFLQAGDADMDCDFDQLDLVQVQVAAKYLTGQPATWGEGDWDGAPGGSVEDKIPPPGDGQFNQLDIIGALNGDAYLKGSYCAEGGFAARAVPEPSTFFLLTLGLTGISLGWRRKR